jgi:hypothetical protein
MTDPDLLNELASLDGPQQPHKRQTQTHMPSHLPKPRVAEKDEVPVGGLDGGCGDGESVSELTNRLNDERKILLFWKECGDEENARKSASEIARLTQVYLLSYEKEEQISHFPS